MGKVVESKNLQEFIENGRVTFVPDHVPAKKGAPSSEVAPNTPVVESGGAPSAAPAATVTPAAAVPADELRVAEDFGKQQYTRAQIAEERAAELERQVKANKSQPPAPATPAVDPNAPTIEKFTDAQGNQNWPAFIEATSKYAAQTALQGERNRVVQEETEKAFKARLDDATTRYPDFLQVLEKADVTIQDDVLHYMTESQHGADLTYYLAKNPDEAERIRKLSPARALAEVGKIEERAPWGKAAPAPTPAETPKEPKAVRTAPGQSSPSTRRTREAPPPINPLPPSAGAGNAPVDPSRMGYRELREYERNRARAGRARR